MARIRSIKPEFWTDETVVELDYADRLFFIGLWNFADDHGYIDYRPKRIKMQVFPGDDYDVVAGLERLHKVLLISLYGSETGLIVYINGWDKHQRVSNPTKEKYVRSDLVKHDDFYLAVQSPHESSRVIGKGREGKGSINPPPDPGRESEDRFDEFWASYPRRIDKGHARKAWTAAVKKTDPDTVIGAARSFSVMCSGTDPKFVAYPATWLNGERWTDEAAKPPSRDDAWGGVQWSK